MLPPAVAAKARCSAEIKTRPLQSRTLYQFPLRKEIRSFLGRVFFTSEITMALMGFLFMALGFGISAIIFKIKKRYFSPIVTRKEEE